MEGTHFLDKKEILEFEGFYVYHHPHVIQSIRCNFREEEGNLFF